MRKGTRLSPSLQCLHTGEPGNEACVKCEVSPDYSESWLDLNVFFHHHLTTLQMKHHFTNHLFPRLISTRQEKHLVLVSQHSAGKLTMSRVILWHLELLVYSGCCTYFNIGSLKSILVMPFGKLQNTVPTLHKTPDILFLIAYIT